MQSFTPRSIIAGICPATRGRDADQAIDAAAGLLGCEQVALIHSRAAGQIWYLAAPAADLASHPESQSPLAAALPGMPGHEGDGAYTADLPGGLQAVVVKQGLQLHSFVGLPALVQRFIALEGAGSIHACAEKGRAWEFPASRSQRLAGRLQLALTASGLLVALLAALAWLWAAQSGGDQQVLQQQLRQQHQDAWQKSLRELDPPAYPLALQHFQRAVGQAVSERGSLLQFEYRDGRSIWRLKIDQRIVQGSAP